MLRTHFSHIRRLNLISTLWEDFTTTTCGELV